MNVTRFAQAPEYVAPNHFDMLCQRLQGREAGPAEQLWLGVSTIAPGGHTGLDGSPMEKHYVVLEGGLVLIGEIDGVRQEAVLGRFDSCRFAPGEKRQLVNRSQQPARVLLAMPLQPPQETKE
ncbi:cupin domain-containing protein [Aquabacterium sp.]|uniref:cupin domain-containing protein n=1 Tax=Aquabacterium sp. TaxID=1872578 RepID=UPI002B62394F|nr:cupin domain-containing protein [Aquabacterium sp.]HSW05141.1 cupin domain-containing protein [Aquabacterium sp.]